MTNFPKSYTWFWGKPIPMLRKLQAMPTGIVSSNWQTKWISRTTSYVSDETLIQYLQSAKIYAIPYLEKEQITSGTLAYAIGVGAAIVSTSFWYAEEVLGDGRGRLVPFNDPDSMALEIIRLLENNKERDEMRSQAYQYGRSMVFEEVARGHLDLISEVCPEI